MVPSRLPALSRLLARCANIYGIFAVGAGLGVLCSLAAPVLPNSPSTGRWLIELGAHWAWPASLVSLLVAARGRGWVRRIGAVSAALGLASLAHAYTPLDAPAPNATQLHVATANALISNLEIDKVIGWVRERNADVVMVQEVSPALAAALDVLPEYPYRKVIGRVDGFGIALLSKHPLKDIAVLDAAPHTPAIEATMTWQGHDIALIAAHPLPPVSHMLYLRRDVRLEELAHRLKARGVPAIIAGDFNATPWSAGVRVMEDQGLRRANALTPTWPAQLGPLALIPIDQIMVSKEWRVASRKRGPNIGSDHYPVEVSLIYRDAAGEKK